MDQEYAIVTEKMDKTILVLKEELANIRAGRANPHLLDKLVVEYYGTPTPVSQVANISIPGQGKLSFNHGTASCCLQSKGNSCFQYGVESEQ